MERLKIDRIEYKSSKLLGNLNMQKNYKHQKQ